MLPTLTLPMKGIYFDEIKAGCGQSNKPTWLITYFELRL